LLERRPLFARRLCRERELNFNCRAAVSIVGR
jgi:hypothetical protein